MPSFGVIWRCAIINFSLSYAPSWYNQTHLFPLRRWALSYPIQPRTSDEARNILSEIDYERDERMLDFIWYSLSYLIEESPLEAYSIALDMLKSPRGTIETAVASGIQNIARAAARNSLFHPPPDPWEPQMGIELADYKRFIDYRPRCVTILLHIFRVGRVPFAAGTEWVWFSPKCGVCPMLSKDKCDRPQPGLLGSRPRVYPTVWWAGYWQRLLCSLDDFPCEKAFMDRFIWDVTMRELSQECSECHKKAVKQFPRFRKIIVGEISAVLDDVCILR